jgi:hypothetical protein
MKVAHNILKEFKYSPRLNYLEEEITHQMVIDVEGAMNGETSQYMPLADRLRTAIEGVKFDMSGIDHICLDCTQEQRPVDYDVL